MIENDERFRLRKEAKDFIVSAGSPVTGSQITNALGTNNHMTERIINEFKDAGLIRPFMLGKNTDNPITAWEPTPELKKIDNNNLFKIIKIEKPRDDKNK